MSDILIVVLIFTLSFVSGMLGLGVAFIAIPVLGLFGFELIHVIMPWALLLNGLTSIAAAVKFMQKKMVDYKTAIPLLLITTAMAPLGVYLLRFVDETTVWWIFAGILLFLAYRMACVKSKSEEDLIEIPNTRRVKAGFIGAAIGTFAGFLGVGPGFLMMPTLVMLGYSPRIAAATNALIVTLPSFSAFVAHLPRAQFDWPIVTITAIVSVIGAQFGAAFMARKVKSKTLAQLFALVLVGLAAHRIYVLL